VTIFVNELLIIFGYLAYGFGVILGFILLCLGVYTLARIVAKGVFISFKETFYKENRRKGREEEP
jgi:hypothetical protein